MKEFFEVSDKSMQTYSLKSEAGNSAFRNVCSLLFLLLFIPHKNLQAQSQEQVPFILSERIGPELDSVEVEYFNIFPGLDGVRSVVYRKDNFENLRMLVSLSSGKDTTITYSRLATLELQKLIDKWEKIPDSTDLIDWKLLPEHQPSRLNYFENTGRNVRVETAEGTFSGRLLWVADSALYIWLKKGDFKPYQASRFIKTIPATQIRTIEVKPNLSSKLFGASLGAGLAIGALQLGYNVTGASDFLLSTNSVLLLGLGGLVGAVGGFFFDGISSISRFKDVNQDLPRYQKIQQDIRAKAMFNRIFPPELKNLK